MASNLPCHEAFERLDALAKSLDTIKMLASCYADSPDEGSHVVRYVHSALADATADVARMVRAQREVANV